MLRCLNVAPSEKQKMWRMTSILKPPRMFEVSLLVDRFINLHPALFALSAQLNLSWVSAKED